MHKFLMSINSAKNTASVYISRFSAAIMERENTIQKKTLDYITAVNKSKQRGLGVPSDTFPLLLYFVHAFRSLCLLVASFCLIIFLNFFLLF